MLYMLVSLDETVYTMRESKGHEGHKQREDNVQSNQSNVQQIRGLEGQCNCRPSNGLC